MHGGNKCRCGHHVCAKVLVALAWVAAILFWWADWTASSVAWMDAEHLFRDVVILSLLAFGTKFCGCCSRHGMGMMQKGGMSRACACGSCEGGKCDSRHAEGHQQV